MKSFMAISLFAISFNALAARISCQGLSNSLLKVIAVASTDNEIRNVKVLHADNFGGDDVLADESTVQRDANYRPKKYKNSIRFKFNGSSVGQDFEYSFILPTKFSRMPQFQAVILLVRTNNYLAPKGAFLQQLYLHQPKIITFN
jgi:hypothetical protein